MKNANFCMKMILFPQNFMDLLVFANSNKRGTGISIYLKMH
jgi:hypothetical protein